MTTQRYCRVYNVKIQRDYYQAMERIIARCDGQGAYLQVKRRKFKTE
jgi:hypothetical protein